MTPTETAAEERELARLLGERFGRLLQGLYSVGTGVSLTPGFAPDFLPPRLELLVATAQVLANLNPPKGEINPHSATDVCRHVLEFRDLMLAWSAAAAGRRPDGGSLAGRLGATYLALLTAVESFLRLFLVERSFAREKEVGRAITAGLISAASAMATEAQA